MNVIKNLRPLLFFPAYIRDGVAYHLGGFLFTPRPRFVCFPVTFRCNSRCQMCNIWQNPDTTGELDLNKIGEVFSSRLFKRVEEVVLHGGEPTLRKDIKDIYRIIMESCPKLKNITLSTNGLKPEIMEVRLQEILSLAKPKAVHLTFSVSLDGLKTSHEKIRGIKGGFDLALRTLEVLKRYRQKFPLKVEIITVIQPQNQKDLEGMKKLAKGLDVELIFQPLMIDAFYGNSSSDPRLQFSEDQWREYREFIKSSFIHEKSTKSLYWNNYLDMLEGGKRTIPCAYDRYVLSLYPTGDVLPCSKEKWILFGNVHEKSVDKIWYSQESKTIRKRMKKEVCPACDFYCGAEYSLRKEFFIYFSFYLRRILSSLFRYSKD